MDIATNFCGNIDENLTLFKKMMKLVEAWKKFRGTIRPYVVVELRYLNATILLQ
jgi:hypothetical protein